MILRGRKVIVKYSKCDKRKNLVQTVLPIMWEGFTSDIK